MEESVVVHVAAQDIKKTLKQVNVNHVTCVILRAKPDVLLAMLLAESHVVNATGLAR